jgi:hypothetical protein
MLKQTDTSIYQHYYIEKNLLELNNQRLDYEFNPIVPTDSNWFTSEYAWLLYIMVGALCLGVVWAIMANRKKTA